MNCRRSIDYNREPMKQGTVAKPLKAEKSGIDCRSLCVSDSIIVTPIWLDPVSLSKKSSNRWNGRAGRERATGVASDGWSCRRKGLAQATRQLKRRQTRLWCLPYVARASRQALYSAGLWRIKGSLPRLGLEANEWPTGRAIIGIAGWLEAKFRKRQIKT